MPQPTHPKRKCLIAMCYGTAVSKGLCQKHYKRLNSYGDPLAGPKFNDPSVGQSHDPLYGVWRGMLTRCENPNSPSYNRYGGRGIKVCERWRNSFLLWKNDMGPRPLGYTIERIDNDGDYTPTNCEWAPTKTQANNTRTNSYITWNGERKTLQQWADITGIKRSLIRARLNSGWSIERALTTKPEPYRGGKKARNFTFNGETHSLKTWAKKTGISFATLISRVYQFGWTFERAITEPIKDQTPIKTIINGETKRINEVAIETGLNPSTVRYRIKRGWKPDEIVTKTYQKPRQATRRKDAILVYYEGSMIPLTKLAKILGISYNKAYYKYTHV
jgi:hypothetical protein